MRMWGRRLGQWTKRNVGIFQILTSRGRRIWICTYLRRYPDLRSVKIREPFQTRHSVHCDRVLCELSERTEVL